MSESYRVFTGTTPDGDHVLVRVWDDGHAELAFRLDAWQVWGVPTELVEEPPLRLVRDDTPSGG